MEKLMSYAPIIIVCIPILITILFYQLHFRMKHNKWKATHFAVQSSVIFYILAVIVLLNWIFSENFLGLILIVLLISLSIILILQWKNKTEVILLEGFVVLSRLSFLVFATVYVCLLIYVVISGYLA